MRKIFLTTFLIGMFLFSSIAFAQLSIGDSEKISSIETDTQKILQNVQVEINVGGTDYETGDEALIFAQVFENSQPILDGFCNAQVFFPNRTIFDTFNLDLIPFSRGIYATNFTVPDISGIYIVDTNCVRPTNATSSIHHFTEIGANLRFINSTGTGLVQETILDIDIDTGLVCLSPRFSETTNDFLTGEFPEIRFLDNITDFTFFFENSLPSSTFTFNWNFIKRTTTGEVQIGSTVNQSVTVVNSPTLVSFPDTTIEFPFEKDSVLELELCFRKLTGASGDLILEFNSTTEDSQFLVNGREINQSLAFDVGGSSELNVKDLARFTQFPFETNVLHNNDFCLDNTTQRKILEKEVIISVGGIFETANFNTTTDITCQFGCDSVTQQCSPNPFIRIIMFSVIFLIFTAVIIILFRRFSRL